MNTLVVIDTNVLVSALLSKKEDSATVQVIMRMLAGEIIPLYSVEIMNEYHEVLKRKKFGFQAEIVDYFLSAIEKFGILLCPAPTGELLRDLKDLPFYELVLQKEKEGAYLVTGNIKHFPKKDFIVTSRELLNIIDSIDHCI